MLLLKIYFSFYASAKDLLFITYFLVSLQIHIPRASIFSFNYSRIKLGKDSSLFWNFFER